MDYSGNGPVVSTEGPLLWSGNKTIGREGERERGREGEGKGKGKWGGEGNRTNLWDQPLHKVFLHCFCRRIWTL